MKSVLSSVLSVLVLVGCSSKPPVTPTAPLARAPSQAPPPAVNPVNPSPEPVQPAATAAAPVPTTLPPSAYDGSGSPAEKVAAEKSKRNQRWVIALKRGSDAEKQQAKRAVEALPAAERAEFDKLSQAYGVSLKSP